MVKNFIRYYLRMRYKLYIFLYLICIPILMSVTKLDLYNLVGEIHKELNNTKHLLDSCVLKVEDYPEELLLHLVMLRTELKGIYYEIDDYKEALGDIHYSKKGDLEEYRGDIRKRWNKFERDDRDSRKELLSHYYINEMLHNNKVND